MYVCTVLYYIVSVAPIGGHINQRPQSLQVYLCI